MSHFAESYVAWLADYYLLTTILMTLALAGAALLKQPAQRLMVAKSTLAALVLLAILSALPGWSIVHLLAADAPSMQAASIYEEPGSVANLSERPYLNQATPTPPAAAPISTLPTVDSMVLTPNDSSVNWAALVATAHLAGVACIVCWLGFGWVASLRLRRTAHPAARNVSAILDRLEPASTHILFFTHDRLDVAVALGVWRPMILLPSHWANRQSVDELRTVLAHESAHVRNCDLQWVALVRALFIPLWANPLFWLIKRCLRLDQEALADAAAAEVTSRQEYAEQLVAWARNTRSRPALQLSSAIGLWEGPSQLRQRIAILLDDQLTVLRSCSQRWRITVTLASIAATTVLSLVTLQPLTRAEEQTPSDKAVEATEPTNSPASESKETQASDSTEKAPSADDTFDQAYRLIHEGSPLEAVKLINPLLEKDPTSVAALFVRANAWNAAREDRKAIADYERIRQLNPSRPRKMVVYNNLAFTLATSPDDGVRDGKRAVDFAETAKVLQETPSPDVLDTLAAAYAEAGQFDRAVKTEQEAIEIAPETQREGFRKYLTLYEAHQPRRETKSTPGSSVDKVDKKDAAAATAINPAEPPRATPNTIIGRTVDEKRQPIPSAEVFLFRINRVDASRKLVAKKLTNADGVYRFENVVDVAQEFLDGKLYPINPLESEFVQVYARAPGRATGMQLDLRQRIASTGVVFDMQMAPAAKLTGRVTGPDGKPVAGALVTTSGYGFATWDEAMSDRTQADGTYVIDDVPPYSLEEYRKIQAEQQRSANTFVALGDKADYVSFSPPMLTVKHPDFAIQHALYEKIPGTQDVALEPPANIAGQVLFDGSGKPAAGATVHLSTSRTESNSQTEEQLASLHRAEVRAGADGKYKFTMLPAGNYDLSVEFPGWLNAGIYAFPTESRKISTAPNLLLTKGGVISIRLIDDETGKPLTLTPDVRADISSSAVPFSTAAAPSSYVPQASANPSGRFELQAPPGKRGVMVSFIYLGEKPTWTNKPPASERELPTVEVVDGKSVDVDIRVMKLNGIENGLLKIAPPQPAKPKPKTDASSPTDRNDNSK